MAEAHEGLVHEKFTLIIDKTIEGYPPAFLPLECQFEYTYDFSRGIGNAILISISGVMLGQYMFPMGILGMLAFMARERFWVTLEDGTKFYAYRVLLNIKGEERSAAIMLGESGDVIVGTSNWGAQEARLLEGAEENA